jgi:hypothetical protein
MKILVAIILTALLAFIAGLQLPWWSIAIASCIVSVIVNQRGGTSFLSGFLGVFILWAGLAWWIDMSNQGVLSSKIALLLPLGGNAVLLILVTAFIGALVGGFGALTGSYLRAVNKTGK